MKGNIKEIMVNKHNQDINYAKIINKIDDRKQKSYSKYLKPLGGFACACLVLLVVFNNLPMMSKSSVKYEEEAYDLAPAAAYGMDNGAMFSYESYDRGSNEVSEAKIIHTANISFETKDYDASIKALNELIDKYDGYVLNSNIWSNEYEGINYQNGNYTIRIPVNNYQSFMSDYDGVGNPTNVSSNQDDITDDYIDVKTRIETLSAQEKRLVELLSKAEDLKDVISIEDKIAEVRYEIESYQSKMNYYTKVTDYATIDIYINEVINYTNKNKIISAFEDTIDNFISFLEDVLVFVIYALPFILSIVLIVVVVLLIIKRKNRNS